MNPLLSIFDILLTPFYIIGAYAYGYYVTKKNIREKPEYKYFTKGLMTRVVGAMALGVIYFFIIQVAIQLTIFKHHQLTLI